MTLDILFERIAGLTLVGESTVDSVGETIIVESEGYGFGSMPLSEAWEDFKDDINTLKEAGIRTSYDDNIVPDKDDCAYTIVINLKDNQ